MFLYILFWELGAHLVGHCMGRPAAPISAPRAVAVRLHDVGIQTEASPRNVCPVCEQEKEYTLGPPAYIPKAVYIAPVGGDWFNLDNGCRQLRSAIRTFRYEP